MLESLLIRSHRAIFTITAAGPAQRDAYFCTVLPALVLSPFGRMFGVPGVCILIAFLPH